MNLVLNHGIFGFAAFHGIIYFNGVKEHLAARFPNLRILVAQVPPDGTIVARGTELGRQILQALQPGGVLDPRKQVHIIAHSMGGLDARFLLSPDNPENLAHLVASLTTISTPHQGSPIADLLIKLLDPLNIGAEEKLLARPLRASLAQIGLETGGLRNLTTASVREFNSRFRDDENTKKFSVAGTGRGKQILGIHLNTCAALHLAYDIIRQKTGEDNDGLVSLGSASWGSGPDIWAADHADEIGHDLDRGTAVRPAHFNHLDHYERLVERLRQL